MADSHAAVMTEPHDHHDHHTQAQNDAPPSPSPAAPLDEQLLTDTSDHHPDGTSDTSTEQRIDAVEQAPPPSPPRLLHTRSSPSLSTTTKELVSDAGDLQPIAVTPTPTPAPPTSVKSNSSTHSKPQGRDSSLRIFFPTDDIALKAILSPPILRTALSSGSRLASSSTQQSLSDNATSTAATTTNKPTAQPSLAESFLETTSRLFFLRGNTSNAKTTEPTTKAEHHSTLQAPPPPPPPAPALTARPSTTSIAIEEDITKLNNSIVAAHPNLPPPPFANMFSCENCHDDIGSLLTQGRHHCRNCGGSFCATCSTKTSVVPYQLYLGKGEQRVCDGCFARIRVFHAQAQTTQVTWGGLPPPSADAIASDFDLPATEQPVTVFNCSYFVDFAPFYGHLILTREHLCFRGYKTHKIKIPFADFHSLVKPEFYYINALQITVKSTREKLFFAEFNGLRDLCFLRIDQLIRAYQEGHKLQQSQSLTSDDLKQQALGRRRSYKILASSSNNGHHTAGDDLASFIAASANGSIDVDDEDDEDVQKSSVAYSEDHDEAMSTTSSNTSSDEANEPFIPLPPDPLLSKMTMLLDCELRADVQVVFDSLWSDELGQQFQRSHMEKTKDIDIDIEDWQAITPANDAKANKGFVISKENDYTVFRHVISQHPPKTKFPGLPPYAHCCRTQRLRVEKTSDGTKWNRFVVSELLRMSKIPFSDYFEIETRWVFTRDGKNYCHVQAGLIVNFLKSTWFKSQIDSSTRSETKEGLEVWAKNALLFLQDHVPASTRSRRASAPVQPLALALGAASAGVEGEKHHIETTSERRRSVKSIAEEPAMQRVEPSTQVSSSGFDDTVLTQSAGMSTLQTLASTITPSMVQWITLVLLLYCVVIIHGQQAQIHQLHSTTEALIAKLDGLGHRQGHGGLAHVCEQRAVDGAVETLVEYFKQQQHQQQ